MNNDTKNFNRVCLFGDHAIRVITIRVNIFRELGFCRDVSDLLYTSYDVAS